MGKSPKTAQDKLLLHYLAWKIAAMGGNLLSCTTALISWTRTQIEAKQALYLNSISHLGKQVLNMQGYTNHNWLSKINWFNTGWLASSWVFD